MIAADLKIGGFNGSWGSGAAIERKTTLLRSEGVRFNETGDRIRLESIHRFGAARATTPDESSTSPRIAKRPANDKQHQARKASKSSAKRE